MKNKQKRPKKVVFPTVKKCIRQTSKFTDHQHIRTEAPLSHTRASPFPPTNSLKSSYQPTLVTKACAPTFVPSKRHAWSVFTFDRPKDYSETSRRTSIIRSIREAGVCPQIPSKRIKRQVTSLSQPPPVPSISPIFKPVNSPDNKPLPSPQQSPCIEKKSAPVEPQRPLVGHKIYTSDHIETLYTLMTNNPAQEDLNDPLTLSCASITSEITAVIKEDGSTFTQDDSSFTPNKLHIPLLHDGPVSKQISSDRKALEREYWRRQRRVFLRSRFITDKEATFIARKVYHNTTISSNYRFITSFLSNMANYRTKWRKGLKRIAKKLLISKEQVVNSIDLPVLYDISNQIDQPMLDSIWKYWITDPYVDPDAFYSNHDSVARLMAITVCAVYFTLRVMHGHMKEGQYRKALRKLDSFGMTCSITLPDPTHED
ncbi:hypothetical protein CLU79DRAFT_836038 [Phycomyces nitens]|nr:hypothetical protein CLU79DRAFT_836038 [Phycomyces nitens]